MSNFLRNNTFAIFCVLALAIAGTVRGVDAQTDDPIFDEDDLVCCVVVNDTHWVVPVALQSALEWYLEAPGAVSTMAELIDSLLPATTTSAVRFEGGFPSAVVALALDARGYMNEVPLQQAAVPGAFFGVLRSF